jgi:GMP synthase-like glutamine amidotransferase
MTASGPHFLTVVCDPVAPSGLIGQTILACGGFYDTIVPEQGFASWSLLSYPGMPEGAQGYDGLVILGGPMSANDEDAHPWLRDLRRLVLAFEADDKPVLGACLGAQIITLAHGGRVWHMGEMESGFVEMELTEGGRDDALFEGLGPRLTLFQNHYEAFDLPPGAVNLVTGGKCEVQAFRLGRATYGFQFHVEVLVDSIREWMRRFGPQFLRDAPWLLNELDPGFRRHMEAQRQVADRVLRRWVGLARQGVSGG